MNIRLLWEQQEVDPTLWYDRALELEDFDSENYDKRLFLDNEKGWINSKFNDDNGA
jgi:hypothetical protein